MHNPPHRNLITYHRALFARSVSWSIIKNFAYCWFHWMKMVIDMHSKLYFHPSWHWAVGEMPYAHPLFVVGKIQNFLPPSHMYLSGRKRVCKSIGRFPPCSPKTQSLHIYLWVINSIRSFQNYFKQIFCLNKYTF